MSDDAKETCMKELGFQVFDQDEKVTAIQLSNTWSIPLAEAIVRLEAFAKKNEAEELQREFLVRGVSKKTGTAVVTVISEDRVKAAEKRLDSFSKSLFSVTKKRISNESLNYKLERTAVIALSVGMGNRDKDVHVIPEARPAMEKEKKKSLFAAPAKKPEEVKKPAAAEPKKVSEEKTPQKASTSSTSPKKGSASPKKNGVPVQNGKGSIASFFGQKPGGSTVKQAKPDNKQSPKRDEMEVDEVPEKVKPVVQKEKVPEQPKTAVKSEPQSPKVTKKAAGKKEKSSPEDSSRKRNLSSDRGSDVEGSKESKPSEKEPSTKKAKKEVKTKKVDKRSRIMAICDSDSSGDESKDKKKSPSESEEEKEEEADAEPALKVEPKKASPDENRNPENKRRKAFRKVTKSYATDDGFIRTVRETEEYSCSDEETPEPTKKVVSPVKKGVQSKEKTPSTPMAKAPTKQGSIMSFFGKK